MKRIVEKVKTAIVMSEGTHTDDVSREVWRDGQARAAIKATLEHLQDYASSEMIAKGYAAMQNGVGPFIAVEVLRAMLSQALSEIEDA